MDRKQTIDRALMSLDIVMDYLDAGGHKTDAVASVLDAERGGLRKAIRSDYGGNLQIRLH